MISLTSPIKLLAVGDVMLGDHPVCIGHGIRSTIEKKGFDFITGGIKDRIQATDISFGNLETILSDAGYRPEALSSAELRGSPAYASYLSSTGFNLINIANNHCMQHGLVAFKETIDLLKREKMEVIGLMDDGKSNLVIREKGDAKLAFLGYSLRPEKYSKLDPPYALLDEDKIIEQVVDIAGRFDGSIVVSLHWGEEYLNYPSRKQMLFARRLIDNGASLIFGHHPHVLQGIKHTTMRSSYIAW